MSPFVLGLIAGLAFGVVNLVVSWVAPLSDDMPGALLLFYGPMFVFWAVVAYRAVRRSGRGPSGISAGGAAAEIYPPCGAGAHLKMCPY